MEFHLKLDKFHQKYGRLDKQGFTASFDAPIVTFDVEAGAAVIRDFDSYAKTSTSSEPTSHMKMNFYSSGDFYDFMTYAARISGGKSKS